MLSSLPKLLERGFVLGFVLPSILFCLYFGILAIDFPAMPTVSAELDAFKIAPTVLFALVLSVLLIALNRFIIRTLEGYGKLNPLRVLTCWQRSHFQRQIAPLLAEAARVEIERKSNPNAEPNLPDFSSNLAQAMKQYPDRAEDVLATKFGNVMRAGEVYSRVVYELDAIPTWPRLYMVLPKSAKDQLRDSRATLDFNANLFVLSVAAIVIASVQFTFGSPPPKWYFLLCIPAMGAIYGWFALPQSAHQWGEVVKSTIEMHRNRLAKELGLTIPGTLEAEREMWRQVSRMMMFRSTEAAAKLSPFRAQRKSASHRKASDVAIDSAVTSSPDAMELSPPATGSGSSAPSSAPASTPDLAPFDTADANVGSLSILLEPPADSGALLPEIATRTESSTKRVRRRKAPSR